MATYTLHGSGCRVCIYDIDHPHPHCHVIYSDDSETVVNLPALTEKHGRALTRQVRTYLWENLEVLCIEFDIRHPKK
jgi:DNA-directed RNA polymerase subunit L